MHDYPRYVWNITEEPYDFTTFDVLKFSEMREKISRLYRTIRNLCSIDLWFLLFSKAKKKNNNNNNNNHGRARLVLA